MSVFEEEDYFTPIFTLPRDDNLFGKWPFKYATVYGYRNDPEKPHDLFSVFEPHMIYKEFEQMEKMKLVKQGWNLFFFIFDNESLSMMFLSSIEARHKN